MIRFGGPSGVQMMLDISGFAIFMMFVAEIGAAEAEATSLAFRISQVAFMPVWGFGMATAVLVGQKLGEDRPDLAVRAARTTLSLSLVYMGVISLVFVLAPRLFLQTFFTHGEAPAATASVPTGVDVEAMTSYLMRFVAAYNMFDAAVIIFVSVLARRRRHAVRDVRELFHVDPHGDRHLYWRPCARFQRLWRWWFIAIWVCALAVIYVARYRTGKWQAMRVIDQIHHAHGARR